MRALLCTATTVLCLSFAAPAAAQAPADPAAPPPPAVEAAASVSLAAAPASAVTPAAEAVAPAPPPLGAPAELVTNQGFSLGFTLHRFQDDFGFGVTLGTPTFLDDRLRITLGGGVAWYPYRTLSDGQQVWELYGHSRLVVETGARLEGFPLRLYGFGGLTLLFAPDSLASQNIHPGGVGGFGFEFYMTRHGHDGPVSYLVELGGIGTGAQADGIPGKPIFANGFLITVGLRFYP